MWIEWRISLHNAWLQRNKLSAYRSTVIKCFRERELTPKAYLKCKTKEIANDVASITGIRQLNGKMIRLCRALTKYIKETTIDCKPMKRIVLVLKHYHSLTQPITTSKDRYSCSIRQFLSEFHETLLDDFEHVLHHKPSIRVKQPYITQCNKGRRCIHRNRIEESQRNKLSQREQQQLFNSDDWKNHEHILFLDKMHYALCHNDTTAHALTLKKNEKDIIRRYCMFSVYSTGAYIDHSSESPLHMNLKEELMNSVSPITQQYWENALQRAKELLTTKWNADDNKWRAKDTSTTTNRSIATKFAPGNGIVLELKPKFKNDLNNSKYLDVSS
eukprot:323121_1